MLDECREEQSYRRRKKKDKDSPTSTPTPEPLKVPAVAGTDGWGEDYLDGKGPEQLQCRDCLATFASLQLYKRHLPQCTCSASRPKTLLPLRTADSSETAATATGGSPVGTIAKGGGATTMSRSQFEEMTMLGLARRAERDRQRDGAADRDREHNGDRDGDEEDTKVYRCQTCQMGFGDYVKMLHHSMQEHGAPIPEVSDMREARELVVSQSTHQHGANRNGHAEKRLSNYSSYGGSRSNNHSEMHEEDVQDHENKTEYPNQPSQSSIYDSEDLRDKERIAIEALSAICGGSFLNGFNHSNNTGQNNNNNNDDISKFPSRHPQPLMDHRY
ncbi:hypothetical protein BIW11_06892 [Tropilaelaps mercedesae]|uniref:C2H2-type domain-containing protein n=1 Tax=Tropilaelaps mercedesae TaxID=418985 RepID=A0A1V9XW62_9ACAR|nr:hypothetical protein BIW11_06892 [Tropilaelaps mercedesae]